MRVIAAPNLLSPQTSPERARKSEDQCTARCIAFLLAIVSSFLLRTDALHAQPVTKIRVANIGGSSDHIQVAIDSGIYKKHGFAVENIQIGSSATVVQSLIAGEVSFAHVGAVPVVAAVAAGIDLKIIAVFMNRFNYVMVTLPELQKPADLKGKTLAISRFGSGDEFASAKRYAVGARPGQGRAHAASRFDGGAHGGAARQTCAGQSVIAAADRRSAAHGVERFGRSHRSRCRIRTLYAGDAGALITENRPLVERFMRAYVEGIKFHRSHPEAVIPYLRKFSRQSDTELKVTYENLRKRIREEPVPTVAGLQTIIRSLSSGKEKELDARRVIDTSFFPSAAR